MAKTTRSRRSRSASTPLGRQEPTFEAHPDAASTDLEACLAACELGGLSPFEWQRNVLRHWLGRDALGMWSAPTCGLSVPRQNGKSLGTGEARANYGMLVLGERVVYTAQLQKTATETFEDMAAFFDSPRLRRYVKEIKTALGREQIVLKNGGRVKFLARTRNGGRGQHGDLLIFDESQDLSQESQASFLPAISASPNPQVVYMGTPPDEASDGYVFASIRERALGGGPCKAAWAEWSTDRVGDPMDQSRYGLSNPSMGITIKLSTILAEAEQMPPRTFAMERLGYWPPKKALAKPLIDAEKWKACEVPASGVPDGGKLAYGVKFSPDGKQVALSVALLPDEGPCHVELVEVAGTSRGVGWLSSWLVERADRCAACVVDGRSGAQALIQQLRDGGFPGRALVECKASDAVSAASMFLDAVNGREMTHIASDAMDASALAAVKRSIGNNGAFGFGDGATEPSAPVESAALALWGAKTTKRDPRRKQVVW